MNLFGIILVVGLFSLATGQKGQQYSQQNMPQTSFTCHDKILGGYYADAETNCQMFHICVKVAGVGIQDFRFLCPNSTAFDQEAQICADWGDVDCEAATLAYGSNNFDLYRIASNFESKKSKYVEEDESVFHLQHAETSDARRSKQYIVNQNNQNRQNTIQPPKPSTTTRASPSPFTAPSTTTTTTTFRTTYEQPTTTRIIPSTYRPTAQPKSLFKDNSVSTYRPTNNVFNSQRNSAGNDDEIFKQSQSAHFFNSKNNGKDDFEDDVVKSTKAPIKQKLRGRQRGHSKFRNVNSPNAVTQAPSRNIVSTQKAYTEQQTRQSFTNTPIVVQPVANNRFDYDNFRLNNSTTLQTSNTYRSSSSTSSPTVPATQRPLSPKRDETFFDVPKINQKTQTTKLQSAPAENFAFKAPSSTVKPQASAAIDDFANRFFGAIPQRVIIPSKLSAEQRQALQASNSRNFQSTAASTTYSETTDNPQFTPQFNRIAPNQLRVNNEQKAPQKDFGVLPQKFNFKTQKYESAEPQNPTTQFYNTQYETKGTDLNINLEPTRSAFQKTNNKTFATRQQTIAPQEHINNKPTTFNPQQYYQSEQSQYQNLSPRGFSLAAQKQQEQPKSKTSQPELRPQITSRSEARTHKKFSTLVPKDQYNPTTFKPNNNFSKKPVDAISSQKLDKIQNPNKYYSQFTSTQPPPQPSTPQIITTPQPQPQPQYNQYNTQPFQNNNFQHQTTTRVSNFFSSTPSIRPLAVGEEDDGQYRPELYEKDFFRNKAKTTKIIPAQARNTFNNDFYQTSTSTTFKPQNHHSNNNFNSAEDEFLKTAHSQNIFASGNQLRAEKEREKTVVKYNEYSTITEKSSPRPFSKPSPITTTTVKPKAKKAKIEKDVSYDYQYYDTNADQNDYSDLETIEEFGKTAKNSKSN